jgi:hypothetical protein
LWRQLFRGTYLNRKATGVAQRCNRACSHNIFFWFNRFFGLPRYNDNRTYNLMRPEIQIDVHFAQAVTVRRRQMSVSLIAKLTLFARMTKTSPFVMSGKGSLYLGRKTLLSNGISFGRDFGLQETSKTMPAIVGNIDPAQTNDGFPCLLRSDHRDLDANAGKHKGSNPYLKYSR